MRPPARPEMDILHHSKKVVKNLLQLTLRQKILTALEQKRKQDKSKAQRNGTNQCCFRQTHDIEPVQSQTIPCPRYPTANVQAHPYNHHHWCSQSWRSPAKLRETDACETDGCRHTTHHLWWNCPSYHRIRNEYLRHIERIRMAATKIRQESH